MISQIQFGKDHFFQSFNLVSFYQTYATISVKSLNSPKSSKLITQSEEKLNSFLSIIQFKQYLNITKENLLASSLQGYFGKNLQQLFQFQEVLPNQYQILIDLLMKQTNKKASRAMSLKKLANKRFIWEERSKLNSLLNRIDTINDISIQSIHQQQTSPISIPKTSINQYPDSLNLLFGKVKNIAKIQTNIIKTNPEPQKNQVGHKLTFLNQVHHYLKQNPEENQYPDALSKFQTLTQLQYKQILEKNGSKDDLAELWRLIKITKQNLKQYGEKIQKTKQNVTNLAGRSNSYFNLHAPINKTRPSIDFSKIKFGKMGYIKQHAKINDVIQIQI